MNRHRLVLHHICVLAALASAGGCAGRFKESHLLRTVDANGNTINYFRVEVLGQAIAAQTRYVSGFYDPKVVQTYFGTFSQPPNGVVTGDGRVTGSNPDAKVNNEITITSVKKQDGADGKPVVAEKEPEGPVAVKQLYGNEDGRLVLLLSSNSDAIANALGALSENEAISTLSVQLVNHERYKQAQDTAIDAAVQRGKGELASVAVSSDLGALTDASTQDEATAGLLHAANALAESLGHDRVLISLDEVKVYAKQLRENGGAK